MSKIGEEFYRDISSCHFLWSCDMSKNNQVNKVQPLNKSGSNSKSVGNNLQLRNSGNNNCNNAPNNENLNPDLSRLQRFRTLLNNQNVDLGIFYQR